jgi:hypothetical protein
MTAVTDTYDFLGAIAPQLKREYQPFLPHFSAEAEEPGRGGGVQWGHVPPTFFKSEKVHALFSGLKCPIYRTKKVFLE